MTASSTKRLGILTGANLFRQEWPGLLSELVEGGEISQEVAERHPHLMVIGLVGSIDNDMAGTDMTIGADTALHRITEAVDAISSTAASHQRTFVIEVMGRHCGYLALMSSLASGAERVYLPEEGITLRDLEADLAHLIDGFQRGKRLGLMIRNERANDVYSTNFIGALLEEEGKELFEVRQAILGHLQQGGDPSPFDRIQATRLAAKCIEMLSAEAGKTPSAGVFVGLQGGHVQFSSLEDLPRMVDAVHQRPKRSGGWTCDRSRACWPNPRRALGRRTASRPRREARKGIARARAKRRSFLSQAG